MRAATRAGSMMLAAALASGCAADGDPGHDLGAPAVASSTMASSVATADAGGAGSTSAPAPIPQPAERFAIAGVLVESDDVLLRVAAQMRTDLPCTAPFAYRVSVAESDREVRLAILADFVPATAPPSGVGIACTGFTGPAGVLEVELAAPLAERQLVDDTAGGLRPVWRREVLEPSPLPQGWVAGEEIFTSAAGSATWWRRFQPDPLTVMVYGLDVWMTWGADCQAVFQPLIGAAEVTAVEVRGLPAKRTDQIGGPMLFWQEGDVCVHLWGSGSCNSTGCLAIDSDQLAALAESLRPL